ncbi:MAG: carbon starvation protein A [Rickettsiales bacterium]|nr:carbon starvation protein A [Rickettsiales bacterium]
MNSIILLLIAVCFFSLAYRYYAAFIAAKVLVLDKKRITPANEYNDGCDYIPTNKSVAFGQHFAAIAGAGPLIGPVLAAQFGWGPGFFWILLGSVFAGAVHDMIILFASVRHKGESLATIAKSEISPITGSITAAITFFVIMITLAGVAVAVVNILSRNPWSVFSISMTIPIAMLFGVYIFKRGSVLIGSIIGIILICLAIFAGPYIVESKIAHWFSFGKGTLSILIPLYAFTIAVLPIWLLLVPHGYLSTYMKIGVIVILAISLFFVAPKIEMPFITKFVSSEGPIIKGPWWPYVFITIACGAISGFHALIGTGTTPKLLQNERHVPLVGYGAMLSEAFVSVMALLAVVTLSPADYFAINTPEIVFNKLGMSLVNLPKLASLVGLDVAHRPGGGVSLAVGMANIFSNFSGWITHTMKYWFQCIIVFEALFILTLIDSGTRVARYILQNILDAMYPPLKQTRDKKLHNMLYIAITSAMVSCMWGYLLYTGDISSLWPLFGATNQALAALALAVGTTVVIKTCKKKIYCLVTIIPCGFIFVTAMSACFFNIRNYFFDKQFLNAWICIAIVLMISFVILDSIRTWIALLYKKETFIDVNL